MKIKMKTTTKEEKFSVYIYGSATNNIYHKM